MATTNHGAASWLTAGQGYCGLGATVAALGLATTEPVEVDVVACAMFLPSFPRDYALTPGTSVPLSDSSKARWSRPCTTPAKVTNAQQVPLSPPLALKRGDMVQVADRVQGMPA